MADNLFAALCAFAIFLFHLLVIRLSMVWFAYKERQAADTGQNVFQLANAVRK